MSFSSRDQGTTRSISFKKASRLVVTFLCVYAIDANVICFIAKLCSLGVCLLLHNFGGLNQRSPKRLQPALLRTPSEPHRRAPPRAARSTRTRLDLQPACSAQALEEPHLPVQKTGVSAHGTGQGLSPQRCPSHRLRGLRRLCDLAIQGLPYRILGEGEPPIPLDDEKSLHATVEQTKTIQLNRQAHKPAPDYPWKQRIPPLLLPQPDAQKGTFQSGKGNILESG